MRRRIIASLMLALVFVGCGTNRGPSPLDQQESLAKISCDNGVKSDCILYEKILDFKERRMLTVPSRVVESPRNTACMSTAIGVNCTSY
jgi:hypothetical protein